LANSDLAVMTNIFISWILTTTRTSTSVIIHAVLIEKFYLTDFPNSIQILFKNDLAK
jgi:hypothetical protein